MNPLFCPIYKMGFERDLQRIWNGGIAKDERRHNWEICQASCNTNIRAYF